MPGGVSAEAPGGGSAIRTTSRIKFRSSGPFASEYARVRRLYAKLRIPDATEIEFFNGPHAIHGEGTYRFLHRHLKWPEQ